MSDRAIRSSMVVLAVLGLGVAGYLTYTHYTGAAPVCSLSHGCEKVQSSAYSELGGVPVALLGLIGYGAILAAALAPSTDRTRLALVGLTLAGFGLSAYLTYRELFTIHAVCQWCVSSAVIMTLLAVAAVVRELRATLELGPALDPA